MCLQLEGYNIHYTKRSNENELIDIKHQEGEDKVTIETNVSTDSGRTTLVSLWLPFLVAEQFWAAPNLCFWNSSHDISENSVHFEWKLTFKDSWSTSLINQEITICIQPNRRRRINFCVNFVLCTVFYISFVLFTEYTTIPGSHTQNSQHKQLFIASMFVSEEQRKEAIHIDNYDYNQLFLITSSLFIHKGCSRRLLRISFDF